MNVGTRRAGLVVHRAVRVEELLDPLLHRLRNELPDDPFTPITIVVQSRGMQRWLSHHLSERLDSDGRGIAANIEFPFPGAVIDSTVSACMNAAPAGDPWGTDRLVWPILELLDDCADEPEFQRLASYLSTSRDDNDRWRVVDRRAWQLARGIADVFDRYALYRPDMCRAWAAGRNTDGDERSPIDARNAWQPLLWRRLIERLGQDPVARLDRAIDALHDPQADLGTAALPCDIAFFGISSLPPRHLELLAALATRTSVELYLPTPSTARWREIESSIGENIHRAEPRHPLLASCGRLGDDAAELILGLDANVVTEEPGEVPAEGGFGNLLSALQSGIRDDVEPGGLSSLIHLDPEAPQELRDKSVQVHSCHGPARQAEVLRDVVLGALADDPTLQPRDVLVMTPDVETFAPLVKAAFAGSTEVPDLPVRVADRALGDGNPAADALLAILDLASGRATASEVLDVLGRGPVMKKFGLSAQDLSVITRWVAESGIRWGIDAAHREREGQPADRIHTWRFGLDRLLLGAAMADEDDRLVGDVVPYDPVEGDGVELAGKLAAATHVLFETIEEFGAARRLDRWIYLLNEVIERCLDAEPEERWLIQEVRAALEEILDTSSGPEDRDPEIELDLGAIRTLVENAVAGPRGASGYETGAVTLCALVPMRSIPHKVVCLLGMDDGAFPRGGARLGFDLTDREARVGDRDQRAEDRSLFLEALQAARQHLILTTTGRDVRTNEPLPPAVPLAELLDVLDRIASTGRPDPPVRELITTDHPLNAFSPRNFGAGADGATTAPISFDPVALEAAQARRAKRHVAPFIDGPLPDDVGDDSSVYIDDLVLAALHPTRLLMEHRLGLHLREFVTETEDSEPVHLDPLRVAQLGRSLEVYSSEPQPENWVSAVIGTGTVPAGTPGRLELGAVADEVADLKKYSEDLLNQAAGQLTTVARQVAVDLEIAGRRLTGTVDEVVIADDHANRIHVRYARPNPKHLLQAWIKHLALTAAGFTDLTSLVVTRGPSSGDAPTHRVLCPLAEDGEIAMQQAFAELTDLLGLHDEARRRPLPLFPDASYKYALKRKMPDARSAFAPDKRFSSGDASDEYVEQVYGPDPELDDVLVDDETREEFIRLAERVWGRAQEHERRSADALKAAREGRSE